MNGIEARPKDGILPDEIVAGDALVTRSDRRTNEIGSIEQINEPTRAVSAACDFNVSEK